MVPAASQPALAEVVQIKLVGLFTIGDRRGQDFAINLSYDASTEPSSVSGKIATFKDLGGSMFFTIGDRREEFSRSSGVPTYLSSVYNLGPPTAVVEWTSGGRRVTFSDPTGSLGTISFFDDNYRGLSPRLPGFADLGQFTGRTVKFTADGASGEGTFTYERVPAGVPEPATWGMMILGFGAVGAAMRMRRRKISVSYA